MRRRVVGAGYPRVIGYAPQWADDGSGHYYPGVGVYGDYVLGAAAPHPHHGGHPVPHAMMVHPSGPPVLRSPPWRPMMAPGIPPTGEGHVPIPLSPLTFNGSWTAVGGVGGPPGTIITFQAAPQKPFKLTRILTRVVVVSNAQGTAVGTPIGQLFVGTDLQQAELGQMDLATIGAGGSFDTWVSCKQAEPGVLVRLQIGLTVYPADTTTHTDQVQVIVTGLGHFLH